MSILDTNSIDIVAARPDSSIVKLVISDHLTWDDLDAHSRLLQDKINTYLAFVESGQLHRLEEPRIPDSPQVHIALVAQHRPTVEASRFLGQVEEFLRGAGFEFELEVRDAA
jgi:hypothetical protein